jgi:hypothetical protein
VTIWSYCKVWNLGAPEIEDLLNGPCVLEEKLDGSQFSFGVFDDKLYVRSKNSDLDLENAGMFQPAVDYLADIFSTIPTGNVYRCEYIAKPKHNALLYGRTPKHCLALYDVEPAENTFVSPSQKDTFAEMLGIDVVPRFPVEIVDMSTLDMLLANESFLGGCKIEGVVIKNYNKYGRDGKILAGKYVSPVFREVNMPARQRGRTQSDDMLDQLVAAYKTEARWAKAVQHLRERGELTNSPADIPELMRELHMDIDDEGTSDIAARLVKWAMPKIKKGVVNGFADWYKQKLAELQFDTERSPNGQGGTQ